MQDRKMMKVAVRSLYALQKLRIQQGNRIAAAFRYKLGLDSSQPEGEDEDASNLLKEIRAEFKRITDGIKRITKNTKTDSPLITTVGELALLEAYERMLDSESMHERAIADLLKDEPIWGGHLLGVRGCGTLMAGVIVSEIDIHKCNSISALWKYCGLDVVVNGDGAGEGRSRKKHHLEPKTYTNSDGEIVDTVGITFNPFLKTKLIGVLGSSFIKLGGEYREIYDNHKHWLESHPKHAEKTKGHRHNMAIRFTVKEFLADLWAKWRTLEGLEVRPRYAEEKLGIAHHEKAA
jgi:hypothetical protein